MPEGQRKVVETILPDALSSIRLTA